VLLLTPNSFDEKGRIEGGLVDAIETYQASADDVKQTLYPVAVSRAKIPSELSYLDFLKLKDEDDLPLLSEKIASYGNFSKIMKWGVGDAAAIKRAKDPGLLIDIQNAHVSKEIAAAWMSFYEKTFINNPQNPSAKGRWILMKRVLELLDSEPFSKETRAH
jgi:hypothetical protein